MRVLFLHQNFPAQFVHVARAVAATPGWEGVALVPAGHARPSPVPLRTYDFPGPSPGTPLIAQHYAERAERGAAVAEAARQLKESGWSPDVVLGHGGWGETLFIRDVWPDARVIVHAELCYRAEGLDVGFDPATLGTLDFGGRLRLRARNAAMLTAVLDADAAVAPTRWQAESFPALLRQRMHIIHEGVDTEQVRPDPDAFIKLGRLEQPLRPGDEVLTYVARSLEPHRGFHVLMRALPRILAARPKARAVIVGGDDVSYNGPPAGGRSWKEIFLAEVAGQLDMERVHLVGRVPYETYLHLLQVSAAHVYLTVPFVLSWSMLEAMSAGALVIGSATPPVQEVITDGETGILRSFFDVEGIAETVIQALAEPERFRTIRAAARAHVVARYDLRRVCLPGWLGFLQGQAERP